MTAMHALLVVWLTVAMLAWCPPERGHEGPETMRYAQIAWAALDVAFDPAEKPLFEGPHGRSKTALQILAIAGFESNYRRDVQVGVKRGKAGDSCLMQIIIVKARRMVLTPLMYKWVAANTTEEGALSADDLVGEDPHTCLRVGLHLVRESFTICHDLSMYTNGQCNHEIKAKHREMRAHQHYKMHPAPVNDVDVLPAHAGIYSNAVGF